MWCVHEAAGHYSIRSVSCRFPTSSSPDRSATMGAGHGTHTLHKMAYAEAQSRYDTNELQIITKSYYSITSHGNRSDGTGRVGLDQWLSFAAASLQPHGGPLKGPLKWLFERYFTIVSNGAASFALEDLVTTLATVGKGGAESQSELCFGLLADPHTGRADEAALVTGLLALHEASLQLLSLSLLPLNLPTAAARLDPNARRTAIEAYVSEGLDVCMIVVSLCAGSITDVPQGLQSRVWHWADVKAFCSRCPQVREVAAHLLQRTVQPAAALPASLNMLPRVAVAMPRIGPAQLLTDAYSAAIRDSLPASLWSCTMVLLYSSTQHGFSLTTMLTRMHRKATRKVLEEPSILLVRDDGGAVFGVFASVLWRRLASNFYGDERCFIFQLQPQQKFYRATGKNKNFLQSDERGEGLVVGGDGLLFALALDSEFAEGRSQISGTFSSPQLSSSSPFRVQAVELWGFVAPENLSALHSPSDEDAVDEDGQKKVKSVLDDKQNTFILDMLGKNYSESVRDS